MTWIDYLKTIVTILLLSLSTLHAATIPLTSEEINYLEQHPVIRVGVDQNWPPFDYFHQQKGHQGLSSSILKEVAQRLGLELEYFPAPWNDVLESIKNNHVDMLACAARTPQRESYLDFTKPYIRIDTAVYVGKKNYSILSMADLAGKTVSLPRGNFLHDYLINQYPDIQLQLTLSNEEAVDLVAQGKVDAYIGNMAVANYFIERNFITNTKISFKLPNQKTGFCFATARNNTVLLQLLQKALDNIDPNTYQQITKKWINFFSIDHSRASRLTSQERQWIRNHPTLSVGTGSDWPPYDFTLNGKYQGIARSYLDLLEEKIGVTFTYPPPQTWERRQQQLHDLEIDILPAIYLNNDSDFIYTQPYAEANEFIFVSEKNHEIRHLADIATKRIVFVTGSSTLPVLVNKFPLIQTLEVQSITEALQVLVDQKADLYIDTYGAVSHVAKREGFIGINALFPIHVIDTSLRMATDKSNPTLLAILQKGFNEITDDEKEEISQHWVTTPETGKVVLTKEETQWIQDNPTVTFSGDPLSGPLSFFNKQGQYSGILSDYLATISERTGLTFKSRHFGSFSAALEALKKQEIDLLDAAAYSHERTQFINFTTSHIQKDYVIVVARGHFSPRSLHDLTDRHVGIVKGYLIEEKLNHDVEGILIQPYNSYEVGLKELSKGNLDAFIVDLPTLDYVSEKTGISNIKVSGQTPYNFPLRFAVKKDDGLLRQIINKALASINLNERKAIYRNWVTFEYEAAVDYTLVWQISGVLFLVVAGTLFWSWKLSVEIKQRRKIEKELILAKNIAEKATRTKSEFLANMSHEIRTPMNSVIGFSNLLDELIVDPVQKGYLRSIRIGGKALLGIINDILDLSKIEAGQLKLQYESINPHELFLETEQLFNEKLKQKNLTFAIEIDPDIPEYVLFDGVRLRQILLNLVGNAIKFTEHGGITLKVRKAFKDASKSKLDLEINVIDTGMGIPKENLELIFGIFQQQEGQNQRQFGGTGLGLSICKKLVTMMNGEISATSIEGQGSTFSVNLYGIDVSSVRKEVKKKSGKIDFNPATIMVVDDVHDNRKLVKAIFTNTDITLIEAVHGQDALDQLKVIEVDLIFMDLRMPVLNGYDTVKKLRSMPKFLHLPIIALTASVVGEDLEKIQKFGFDGYIQKPAEKETIINKVAEFLPYASCENTPSETPATETQLDAATRAIVADALSGELMDQWNAVKDKGDIELIRQFSLVIAALADEYHIPLLHDYSNKLAISIDGFDLAELYSDMNQFPDIARKI